MASSSSGPPRRLNRAQTMNMDEITADSEIVPSSLAPIAPILRIANEIEKDNPRVAYLCRFHAFEKAHMLDPASSGRGVRQFKTYLLHRLEKEHNETTCQLARNDRQELRLYYLKFYEENIKDAEYTRNPEEVAKIYQTASVLYDVLMIAAGDPKKIDDKIHRIAKDIERKREQYEHYNILPLYSFGVKPAIMELPEVKVAVDALRNVKILHMPSADLTLDVSDSMHRARAKTINDILDWVASLFGFQVGNVANQREHLILLLANMDIRKKSPEDYTELSNDTVKRLSEKVFSNYSLWCKYLHYKSSLRTPPDFDERELQLVYISLYLLIWGEASNIRFMPECICYIFHNMANEVYEFLVHKKRPARRDTNQTEAAPYEETFLRDVITPIYQVLCKEVRRNKGGKASHSRWRNYDDLNEYFWSPKCFQLKWPMNLNADFFVHSDEAASATQRPNEASFWKRFKRSPKTYFVEVRSFWHLYRSFDRMWIFFIMAFQAMVIIGWNGSLLDLFNGDVFRSVLSIFITSAYLNLLRAALDIVFTLNAWGSLKFAQILRYILKFAVAAVWAVVLPISYSSSFQNPTGLIKFFKSWAMDWQNQTFYSYAIAIYLIPNVLGVLLFFLPLLRKSLERSNWRIIKLIMWWAQPELYVGRGMHEDCISLLRYTLFWIVLLTCKLAFSYFVEVLPLIRPTKIILGLHVDSYQWFQLFPNETHNTGVIVAIWAPIILVYFIDTQIWYSIFSTIFGGVQGAFSHLGEIRTLGMLRSRFGSFPKAFSRTLDPSINRNAKRKSNDESVERKNMANFSRVWNEFIYSMRTEDLISNRDRDLLLMPNPTADVFVVQWPPFLLASKIPFALDMAKDFKRKDDEELFQKIKADKFMYSAVIECYETIKILISGLLEGEAYKEMFESIFAQVENCKQNKIFLKEFRMSALPLLSNKLEKFLTILLSEIEDPEIYESQIVIALQDSIEIITKDVMVNCHGINIEKEHRPVKINIHLTRIKSWREKVVRLHFLLTEKESAINVPANLEAQRRINFFANSLFMNMPSAPKVRDMLSFSILTPYYKEDVLYSDEELNKENEDGISVVFYLKKMYPDEWTNYQERLEENKDDMEELRKWVSYRAQTLSRTVRGMMYHRLALRVQYFLECSAISGDYRGYESSEEENKQFMDRAEALASLKFTYVVSCQVYGTQKKSTNARDWSCYTNILKLMIAYPSLRVAYIDEREETINGRSQKLYYSVLVKGGGDKLDQEIYRIKLPGPPTEIGEGKPENQNHAIIFTRGEALQTIDMNQDNYFEEAYKMRNVLQEFMKRRYERKPTILGIREHIFTGSVSSVAWFMSNQETSFVTIGQRILASPLRVRFHYGHPDIFDKIFHITRGGISKASKVINLSEDIFAGFNSTLRGGYITHHEYIQVGKGRDLGMNQISAFEAKVSSGNGEQTLSRDVYRLGRRFDFYRMLSFYFTTVGFYFNSMVTVLVVYAFLYGRLYLVLSGLERSISQSPDIRQSRALEEALSTQSVFQLGILLVLPIVMEIILEKGFGTALLDFILMQLQLASVFFTFHLGTKAHYFGRTILHGGSIYRATGRGFVVLHAKFAENYRLYSRSHFVKGLELLILLIVYEVYGKSYRSSSLYMFITWSMWFLVASWLFAPFVFNPSGLDWQKTVDDWTDWKMWMGNFGGIGVQPEKSWDSWWDAEQEHLKHTNIRGRVFEVILALRFFIFQYGIVYHLHIAHHSTKIQVYLFSWVAILIALLVVKMISMGRRRLGADFQLTFRILKGLLFLIFVAVMVVLVVGLDLTLSDVLAAILAFLPTGWAILLIGQALRPLAKRLGLWESVKDLARAYDFLMGIVLFAPIAILSWFPVVSEFQTRILFNQAFSRGLQISMILAGRKDKSS